MLAAPKPSIAPRDVPAAWPSGAAPAAASIDEDEPETTISSPELGSVRLTPLPDHIKRAMAEAFRQAGARR